MVFMISSPFLSILLTSFGIGPENVLYYSVFSLGKLNSLSNSFASSFMFKWQSYFDPLWKTTGISLGILYLNYICYVPHLCIYQYNHNFAIVFITTVLMFKLFFANLADSYLFKRFLYSFVNGITFFFQS